VALATLLIAGVVSAVVFHKELARWLESSPFGPAKVAPSGDDAARKPAPPAKTEPAGAAPRPRVGAPEEKAVPRVADETPAPPATIDSIEEKKAAARKVLEQRLAELLDEAGQASERGDWKQVAARCDTAVALDPGNTAALQLLGVASLQQGDAQKALESFRAARERLEASEASVPPALEARIAEALLGLDPPQAGEAGAIAARLLAVTPRDVELHVLRIRALQAQGKTDELRAALGAAQELKLESPELTAAAAKLQAAAAQDRAAQAAVALTEATGALAKGDWRQAAQHATRALELQRSASSAAVLAVAQLAAGEIAAARKTLDAAGEPGGEDAAGKLRLEELRALAGGMEALQRAAGGAAPEGAAELLAAPAASKEPLVQALAQIQLARLSRLGPEDAGAPGPRKAALAAARTRLQAALKLKTFPEPLRGESSYLLGLVQLDLGDAEKSNASYQQALASFAAAEEAGLKTAELYEGWGKAYDRLGNLIRAASRFRSAYELRPTPETCLRAASSYLDANPASREAVEILREGAERFRDNAAILKKLKEIETE
jgi:tetratricopeptide (TPR) repeat protein